MGINRGPYWANHLYERYGVVQPVQILSGGDLSETWQMQLDGRPMVVKWQPDVSSRILLIEAATLDALAQTGSIRVPAPDWVSARLLVLQWIEPGSPALREMAAAKLGRDLAKVHRSQRLGYCQPWGSAIGIQTSPSGIYDRGGTFFVQARLRPLLEKCAQANDTATWLQRLREKLDVIAAGLNQAALGPALVHGDLWAGNWLWDSAGIPYVFDPQGYYGDPQADLAFSEMFGGFPETFYRAYREAYPTAAGYPYVRPIYQLYHALIHLLLFGAPYRRLAQALANEVLNQ